MLVKVKIKDVIHETAGALLLLVSEREVWFPKKAIKRWIGSSIVISQELAISKDVRYSAYTHIPERIDPIYGQEAIDDLRFNPSERG